MKKYEYLLFDLDGTIIDSAEGIYKSFEYALNHYGIKVDDLNELKPVIGPPLKDCFMSMYGFSKDKAIEAVAKYRERYSVTGMLECSVYDGVEELLSNLYNAGYKMVLATSKPEVYAKKILKNKNLDKYFYYIAGAEIGGTITDKEDVLRYILDTLNITDVSGCLMIGDRKYDLIGAKEFGIDALGVLYGFGSLDELSCYPSVAIVETPHQIGEFLI